MMLESKEYPRVKKNSKSRSPNVRKPSNTDKNEETEVDGEDHAPRELMKTGLRAMKRILTENAISQLRDSQTADRVTTFQTDTKSAGEAVVQNWCFFAPNRLLSPAGRSLKRLSKSQSNY
jgi:hypothetical protein